MILFGRQVKDLSFTKGSMMTALVLLSMFALVSLPFALDLYFSTRNDSEFEGEEYVPDGR